MGGTRATTAACLALSAVALAGSPADTPGAVTVSVRPTAAVAGPQVSVGEVASLEGGSAALRRRIGELDLAAFRPGSGGLEVTRDQIAFRLRLAGLEVGQFQVRGAARAYVRPARPQVPEERILEAARAALLRRLPGPPEDVAAEPLLPLQGTLTAGGDGEEQRLEAELRAPGAPEGRVRVDVTLLTGGGQRETLPVYFDVRRHRWVALAARRIERGEALRDDNVRFERRAVDPPRALLTREEGLAGKRAARALAAGQEIGAADIEPAQEPVLVRQRDVVRLVARVGHLRIQAVGEALQDGRAGQVIRVRNVDSKNVVLGRVADRALVEVDY